MGARSTRCCSSCSQTRASVRRSRPRSDGGQLLWEGGAPQRGDLGVTLAELQAIEREHLIGNYARAPVEFVRGEGSRLWDSEGEEYLDFLCGISVTSLGHCHPRIVQAVRA